MVEGYINAKLAIEKYAIKNLPVTIHGSKVFCKLPEKKKQKKESMKFWLDCIFAHYCARMMSIPRNDVLIAMHLHVAKTSVRTYMIHYTKLYNSNKIFKYIADDIINKL